MDDGRKTDFMGTDQTAGVADILKKFEPAAEKPEQVRRVREIREA